jgi:photosystem II stability/assembly factor-like uncharacterized protein
MKKLVLVLGFALIALSGSSLHAQVQKTQIKITAVGASIPPIETFLSSAPQRVVVLIGPNGTITQACVDPGKTRPRDENYVFGSHRIRLTWDENGNMTSQYQAVGPFGNVKDLSPRAWPIEAIKKFL